MGRPTKLTPEITQKICNLIREGNYPESAAVSVGIAKSTYYLWQKKGKEAKRKSKYSEFIEDIKEAIAFSETYHVQRIRKAGDDGNWFANAWWLERRFPDRWGRNDKLDLKAEVEHKGLDNLAKSINQSVERYRNRPEPESES